MTRPVEIANPLLRFLIVGVRDGSEDLLGGLGRFFAAGRFYPECASGVRVGGDMFGGPAPAREIGEAGTVLFPMFAAARDDQGINGEPVFFAYCIEMVVRARFDVDVELAEWSQFPGKNDFTGNPQVQEKVGWIINNSYPTVDLVDLRERAAISGLTAAEAVAGSRYAIWHFKDGERRHPARMPPPCANTSPERRTWGFQNATRAQPYA